MSGTCRVPSRHLQACQTCSFTPVPSGAAHVPSPPCPAMPQPVGRWRGRRASVCWRGGARVLPCMLAVVGPMRLMCNVLAAQRCGTSWCGGSRQAAAGVSIDGGGLAREASGRPGAARFRHGGTSGGHPWAVPAALAFSQYGGRHGTVGQQLPTNAVGCNPQRERDGAAPRRAAPPAGRGAAASCLGLARGWPLFCQTPSAQPAAVRACCLRHGGSMFVDS